MAPAIQNEWVFSNTNWSAANTTYNAPYAVGDNWLYSEGIDADPRAGLGVADQWMTATLGYNVTQSISNFNVSSPAYTVSIQGTGKFGNTSDGSELFNVDVVKLNWSVAASPNNGNASGENLYYHNDSVENWVRNYNSLRYFGYEENMIVAYESEDFRRSNLVVSDTGAGKNLNVSIDITNTTGKTQKFNTLLAVFNLSSTTPTNAFELLNGKCVYPDVASPGGSWPYYGGAIQTTNLLNPGDSQRIYWNNSVTLTAGNDYWIWCSGMIYGPWTAR